MSGADTVLAYAAAQIGKPYKWDTAGPNTFDCSGLVVAAFKQIGKNLPHYTGSLILLGSHVSKADLAPGDLVFPEATHVQIYAGDGYIIEAPHTGANVRMVKMWGFWQGRRLVPPGASIAPGSKASSTSSTTTDASLSLNNPFNLGDDLTAVKQGVRILGTLSNPQFWERFGLWALGGIIVLIGIVLLNRKQLESAAHTAVQVGKKAAETGAEVGAVA